MAEITNNFLQGKMNKDLDERIIPKGQYREAMNVQISTSEGSDVGSVQNIRGTKAISSIASINSTAVCVGSIEDTLTNHIYYFVRCSDRDFIAKYDVANDYSSMLVVDLGKLVSSVERFLKFSGKQITAISIVDNFLFFTDGENEPKKIDLSKNYSGNLNNPQSASHHSRLFVDGVNQGFLKEEHITVIRKKPLRAPQIKINSSKSDTKKTIFERQIPRFCVRYKYDDNQISAFSPFTQPVFNAEYVEDYSQNNFYDKAEAYNTAMLNYIESIEVYGFVDKSIPKDVVEVEILYKTEDSNVVYSAGKIKKTDNNWSAIGSYLQENDLDGEYLTTTGYYLIDSENIYAAIAEEQLLRPYDNVPKTASAQEIVGNRIVYGNYTQNYDVDAVNLTASTVARDQEDNKPYKSIKSQRSYQVGLLFGDAYGRETPIFTSQNASIKAIQNLSTEVPLQISATVDSNIPSWAHYYKFYVKESSGRYYNLLNERLYIPFKHSQFENEEDHVYLSFPSKDRSKVSEDDYIILKTVLKDPESFRVTEDNKYKILDISNEAPEAIAYKFYDLGSGQNDNNIFTDTSEDNPGLFVDDASVGETRRIDQQTDTIVIRKSTWQDNLIDGSALTNAEGGTVETSNKVDNLYVSWSLGGLQSKRYKITNIRLDLSQNYIIRLSEVIQLQDALLANSSALDADGELAANANMSAELNLKIQRKDRFSNENFSGSFFVKIAADDLIKDQLLNQAVEVTATDKILHSEKVYLWLDQASTTYSTSANANIQYASEINSNYYGGNASTPVDVHGGNGLTDTENEWFKLLEEPIGFGSMQGKFFIDGMYMAASNPSNTLYARESGQGWVGSPIIRYPKLAWGLVSGYLYDGSANSSVAVNNPRVYGWKLEDYEEYDTAPVNDFGFSITADYDTEAMDASTDIAFAPDDDGDEESYHVNGIDPIIIANPDYYGSTSDGSGGRIWCNSTIYGSDRVNDLSSDYEQGGFYMHVSFLGPGVDLFTRANSYPNNITHKGLNSLGKYLQGIWGGGAFNHGNGTGFVEMEGHYGNSLYYLNNYNEASVTPPAPGAIPPNVTGAQQQYFTLLGYDSDYQTQHERQFDPTYSANDVASIQETLSNLVAGKRFRFSQDSSEEIYTILNVEVKNVYNHTPWRMRKEWNGTQYVNGGDSVEEAVIAWAENGTATDNSEFTTVLDKLEAFGARSNRRIVYALKLDKNPQTSGTFKPLSQDNTTIDVDSNNNLFEFIEESAKSFSSEASTNKAIFETESEKAVDLDIYYEISDAIPTKITPENKDILFPIGSIVYPINFDKAVDGIQSPLPRYIRQAFHNETTGEQNISVSGESDTEHGFNWFDPADGTTELDYVGKILAIKRRDGSVVHVEITERNSTIDYYITGAGAGDYGNARQFKVKLAPSLPYYSNFYNVFGFGNGVESNTIRDDFNGVVIKTGARASTTLDEPYREETRKHGLIFSGLYNSNTGLNNLNQFIQAQKITKDLNPTYGSIQKLFQRQTNLVVFCEDKVVKVLSNKDAIFNADGNPQLVANERVLGQVTPFVGEFGISKNPESFASESYRAYFTDKQRRAVLRLSMDGLTPISDAGMKDWFGDNLEENNIACLGTYDEDKQEYNLTIKEGHTENLIANAYFEDGVELVETNSRPELLNSAFTGGADFTNVDIASNLIHEEANVSLAAGLVTTQTLFDVTLETDIVAGNWYMVEVDATTLPTTSIFALLVESVFPNDLYGSNNLPDNPELDIHGKDQTNSDYRAALPYHFGQVSGYNVTADKLKLRPSTRLWDGSNTPTLLGIWKANSTSSTFKFSSWASEVNSNHQGFTLDNVKLYDITEIPSMAEPSSWDVQSKNYTMPHAAWQQIEEFYIDPPLSEEERARPMVYYKNNAFQFNTVEPEYLATLYNSNVDSYDPEAAYLQPTYNGFNFSFTVGNNVDTGNISGNLYARAFIPTSEGNAGFRLSNITEPGDYVINYNASYGYEPTIVSQPSNSTAQILNASGSSSGYVLAFSQLGEDTFEGSVSNISLIDATPSFTGGGVDSWTFTGFDPSIRNDLYWDESTGSLVWENIDIVGAGAIMAKQNIGDLQTGATYRLSFDYKENTGNFRFYYWNSENKGFSSSLTQNEGHFNQDFVIAENNPGYLTNALAFFFSQQSNSGSSIKIDNIILRRVLDLGFVAKTLSYSEDVKGWVSFKSFIPESGLSLGGDYYTFKNGAVYKHHADENNYNSFYNLTTASSYIDFIFNDSSSVVKDFKTLLYEGSASKKLAYASHESGATDIDYNNLSSRQGWFAASIETDLQKGSIPEFIKKEGKYYNYIRGGNIDVTNSDDIGGLNVQGLGVIASVVLDVINIDD
tara:strand:- start:6300 stop:13352 length:7053 start_codon:yes stop_codon:yes gene_type:complete